MVGDRGNVSGRSWGERLRKTLGLGAENPSSIIQGPVLPVLEMEPLYPSRPELAWPNGEILGWGFVVAGAGGAANTSRAVLENPPGSGYLLIVEAIVVIPGAGSGQLFIPGATTAGFTDANVHYTRDGRVRTLVAPGGNLAAPGRLLLRNNAPMGAGDDPIWPSGSLPAGLGVILPPGQAIGGFATTLNTAVTVAFAWRARPLSSAAEAR